MSELADAVERSLARTRAEHRRPLMRLRGLGDRLFDGATLALALLIIGILVALTVVLALESLPAIHQYGWSFIVSADWDPVNDLYGALPFIYGTVVSSLIALLIAAPLSLGVALCLSEMAPGWLARRLGFLVELLAAIPSVVYGLWAIFVLGPWLRDVIEPALKQYLGFIPLFEGPEVSVGMLTAGVVLAIMILPYIAAVCTDVFRTVPRANREAALALGATKWEMVRLAVLPLGVSGVIGAIILGLGRALGETIAVAMVIGNTPQISASLFAPSATLASVVANEFVEATSSLNVAALIELGLVLMGLGLLLNIIARGLVAGAAYRRFRGAA